MAGVIVARMGMRRIASCALAERSQQAAALILALREEDLWPPLVPSIVLVECLQGHPGRDALMNRFLKTCDIVVEVAEPLARRAGGNSFRGTMAGGGRDVPGPERYRFGGHGDRGTSPRRRRGSEGPQRSAGLDEAELQQSHEIGPHSQTVIASRTFSRASFSVLP